MEQTNRAIVSDRDDSLLDLVSELCKSDGWAIEPGPTPHDWIRVGRQAETNRAQGWKLHVSASVDSAGDVLRRTVPVLLQEGATFKVAGSLSMLSMLNQAESGLSQIGKFITVYPADDDQAVRLAEGLDGATRGLRGPSIPSDRPLTPGSLVHYRYGGFGQRFMQTPMGEVLPAIETADGELVPDVRDAGYHPPDWIEDPFLTSGVAGELPQPRPPADGRFHVLAVLHGSPRGAVYLAIDLERMQRCVLKRAYRDAYVDARGQDARDRLRYEADVLRSLAPDTRFPAVYDLFEHDGDLYLAMEDVEGDTLEAWVYRLTADGLLPSSEQIVTFGRELASMLTTMHVHGLVYRDLKTSNIIVAPDGRLRLVDFELAHDPTTESRPFGAGTRGYMSPQQALEGSVAVTDDIFSLGAVLYFLATSVEPSTAPDSFALLDRPIELLNPALPAALRTIIRRCLDRDPAQRFPLMGALDEALDKSLDAPMVEPAREAHEQFSDYASLAHRGADTICNVAREVPGGMAWISNHRGAFGLMTNDVNMGTAGVVLSLAELVHLLGDRRHREILEQGARWLTMAPRPEGGPVPGLYVGEAGTGAALLRAGQILDDSALIDAAAGRSRRIAAVPHGSPDLFNGSAGRLRFHLMMWDETGDREHLSAAEQAGEALLAAVRTTDGETSWTIPPGYGGLSGSAYVGYAHGASGIADALLDLYEATGNERLMAAVQGAGRWLQRLAAAGPDGDVTWPSVEGAAAGGAMWCHGSAGNGRFLLHAARLDAFPGALDLACRAAQATYRRALGASPVQCHGLSGNIEVLLDMFQATGDGSYLNDAHRMARLLRAFERERDGNLMWSSESPAVFTPDYLIGYGGVAVCLARLSQPERVPHLLSRAGFQYRQHLSGAEFIPPAERSGVHDQPVPAA